MFFLSAVEPCFKSRAMSRISGLRNDMNKRTIYKERKINNRCFEFLSEQNIIVPLILDINIALILRGWPRLPTSVVYLLLVI